MTQYAVFLQEGYGTDGQHVAFTNDPPTYEAMQVPVFAVVENIDGTASEKIQVGEREETFAVFTPLNGPSRRRGQENRVPFARILGVVELKEEAVQHYEFH